MHVNLTVPMPVDSNGDITTGAGDPIDVGGIENKSYDIQLNGAVLTANLEGSYSTGGQPNDPTWTVIIALADASAEITSNYARLRVNVSAYTSGTPRVEFNGVRYA